MMPRLDSKLEAQGAEFLVLGALLIEGIVAHKTYTNTPGYDLIATNPRRRTSCRIQVKSRWAADYDRAFLVKTIDSDFVVCVALNRGYRYAKARTVGDNGKRAPKFYVFPAKVLRKVPGSKWGKRSLRHIPNVESYVERWDLISDHLRRKD
jgi:hypothetical protein